MMRIVRIGGTALVVLVLLASVGGRAAVAADDGLAGQPPVRFSGGLLAGTGYGWATGTGDVFADDKFSGGGWAALGHLTPELALLFPRVHLFASISLRYQVITGTTNVYTPQGVFHARDHATAFFQTIGWFPRPPAARLQPYLSFSSGRGEIARLARDPLLTDCGPSQNQECVDTVVIGPWLLGVGGGLRARLIEHLDAVLAVDARVGFDGLFEHPGYNLDVSLGMAAVF